jgi:class 3 adenylate cyclase/tetratricopeptide (TPR) repeat protein
MSETRKLAAILVSDVVGYSRLAGAEEERTLGLLRELRSDLIDPSIAAHHGRIVKRTGDGSIVEFRSVVDAVRCAIELQNSMVARNAGLTPEQRIEFRVGVHVGDVVEENDGDLMGDGVNIAARLQGVAKPGGICLSEDAWRPVQGKVEAKFADAGEQRLKNITRPVRAYHLTPGSATSAAPATLSFARRLAATAGVGPWPHSSTREFFQRNRTLIGLLILLALAGSLAIVRHWLASQAPQTVQSTEAGQGKAARAQTKNMEAYDYYLRAEIEKLYVEVEPNETPARAMAFYAKAIELDPNFADAQAGYALAAALVSIFDLDPPAVARKRALNAASRALELDPDNGRAYVALSVLQLRDGGRHADALASARRAVALGPNDPGALANLGVILAYSGDPTEAIAVTERALRLSPSPPPIIRQIAGVVFYIARQYDRAIEEMRAVSAALPAAHAPHAYLAAAYGRLGQLDLARSEAERIPDTIFPKPSLALDRLVYRLMYKRAEDLNDFMEGLKAAGIPEWPFGFEGRPEDQVTGQALVALAVGRTWAGYIQGGANAPFFLQIDKENRVAFRTAHTLMAGVIRLENDRLCMQFDAYLSDLWFCGAVYRTVAASRDASVDYVYVLPDGLRYFSVKD